MIVNRILIIALGGVGNLVMMVSGLRALRKQYPQSKIVLLVSEPYIVSLLDGEGLIDDVIGTDEFGVSTWLRIKRESFDMAIASSGTNALKSSLLMLLSGIARRMGENVGGMGFFYTDKLEYHPPVHEKKGFDALVKHSGVDVDERSFSLIISKEERAWADAQLSDSHQRYVAFHCGASRDDKQWPLDRFIYVAQQLMSDGWMPLLVGGQRECLLADQMIATLGDDRVRSFVGSLSLRQTLAILEQCDLFIGNDSGPAHMAASVGTKTLLLQGSGQPDRTSPVGVNVEMIYAPQGLCHIDMDDVYQKAKAILQS